MNLDHRAQAGQHAYAARGLDMYETPRTAIEALLAVEELPRRLWEPAAGGGAIVRVLRDHGREVIASDIAAYSFPLHGVADFLELTRAPAGVEAIVTNPPYKLAEQFVTHALGLCPQVVMLLGLAFLESQRRSPLLDTGRLARVHVFKSRLPMMHRDGWSGPRASSSICFGWFVWLHSHSGPITVDRI